MLELVLQKIQLDLASTQRAISTNTTLTKHLYVKHLTASLNIEREDFVPDRIVLSLGYFG